MAGKRSRKKTKSSADESGKSPYPSFSRPTRQECFNAVEALQRIHGIVGKASHEQRSVLDSLVRTILSQNTTDKTSIKAFTSLKKVITAL